MTDLLIALIMFGISILIGGDYFISAQWTASWLPTINIIGYCIVSFMMLVPALAAFTSIRIPLETSVKLITSWLVFSAFFAVSFWLSTKIATVFLAATSFSTIAWPLIVAAVLGKLLVAVAGTAYNKRKKKL